MKGEMGEEKVRGTDGKGEKEGIGEMRRMMEREQTRSSSGWLSSDSVTALIYPTFPVKLII